MTPLRRIPVVIVATATLALVGTLGVAPAADAAHRPAQKHVVHLKTQVLKRDVLCC